MKWKVKSLNPADVKMRWEAECILRHFVLEGNARDNFQQLTYANLDQSLWNMQIYRCTRCCGLSCSLVPVADPICNSNFYLNLNATNATAGDDAIERGYAKLRQCFPFLLHFWSTSEPVWNTIVQLIQCSTFLHRELFLKEVSWFDRIFRKLFAVI